jgi:MraZ protein
MFRGSYTTRVDDKGRIKVPADFKRDIKVDAKFYITSTDGKIAQLYPLEVWQKKEENIAARPSMHPAVRKYLDITSYYGQVVELDAQARLLLPTLLREKAGLTGDVTVVGKLERLDVRVADDYRKQVEENPITPEDENALAQLGI